LVRFIDKTAQSETVARAHPAVHKKEEASLGEEAHTLAAELPRVITVWQTVATRKGGMRRAYVDYQFNTKSVMQYERLRYV
jgi:hypothetical protein